MDKEELQILENIDALMQDDPVRKTIESIIERVEQKLIQDPKAPMAWEPVPIATYCYKLPDIIHSSWVFVIRGAANTGAERHPNSRQRMMSYQGLGDLQIWDGGKWCSNYLTSDVGMPLERRWLSIPKNVWHQAVVTEENWVMVSFHTVSENELVEERPDAVNAEVFHQRRYLEG